MHNLTKTLAAMSLLAPLTAHSLGVGDIKLHSALNQKLNAEIALSLAADENLADIRVALATPEKFDKLGIAWSYFLSTVKFHPVVKANGKVVIKMTSDEVVQEPFLDFLVEVSWPKGDIYKEFTVLVDPPVVYQQARIDAPTISPTKPSYRAPSRVTTAQSDFNTYAGGGEYGPINRDDSLWKIAQKVKGSDTSVEQMMMALYKANPGAFYKANVNALMQGKTLKIPEKADVLKLSKKQANTQFYRQMAVWEGKVVAPKPTEVQLVSDADNSNQLTLIPPEDETSDSSAGIPAVKSVDSENLEVENQELQERLANLEKQFAIMQEMMAIKDQQLAVMQNAQVDRRAEDGQQAMPEKPVEPSSQEVTPKLPIAPIKATDTTVVVEKQPVSKLPIVVKKPVPKPKPVVPVAAEEDSEVSYYYIGLGIFGVLSLGAIGWLFWRRRQAEEDINENSMFAASSAIFLPDSDDELEVNVLDEKSSYDVGTVGESSFLSEFTPSDFDVFETDQAEVDPTSEADVYLAYGRYQQAEELMRQAIADSPDKDVYKLKLLEIFYTSENAEGYEGFANELAFEGKNTDLNFWAKVSEMAGELIPDSALFSSDESPAEFATAEDASDDNGDSDDEVVEEAVAVADSPVAIDEEALDFDLSSFSLAEDSESAESASEAVAEVDSDNDSVDFDLSSFSLASDNDAELADADNETIAEADSDIETVDFDFDLGELEPASSPEIKGSEEASLSEPSPDEEIESIEFNTDDIDIEGFGFSEEEATFSEPEVEEVAEAQITDESTNNDFDFNFDKTSDVPVADDASDDIDIESLGVSEEEATFAEPEVEEVAELQVTDEPTNNDFDFNFDEISDVPVADDASDSDDSDDHDEIDLMVSDLTDMDEFETKIDLAKAYIDMGDELAAREIAEEVLDKGNEAQKEAAQVIIDKLA